MIDSTTNEAPGSQIGRYKLLERIGEGGMGTVWLAEQREPVRRRVALKIIKLGMDSKQVIARFEAERQALALMDHPNIAKVLDAGTTQTGRPYFVMEYIRGTPILEYCDQGRLDTRARLELFTSVCQAIQHAHTKGIIHRDIKPSNVMVTLHDGMPAPKVIDFGIAKATSGELTAKTLFTEQWQIIGTPAYMSPEQAEMSGLDVDTRSDIYSLGVLLYELLTGTTPFNIKTLLESGFEEMLRAIREQEPQRPSTRVSSLAETGVRTAEQRRAEPARLSGLLRGDIDWIVMKCLEKDRTRRYETANGLAMDIRRHLAGEAVLAAPPSAGYRLRKFVRRHRAQVAAAGAVAAALVVGIVAFAWQASVAQRERDAAVLAREAEAEQHRLADEQRDRALTAEATARARADELTLVSDFQAGMLEQIDVAEAGRALTADVTARFDEACARAGLPEDARQAERRAFQSGWSRVNATDAARALIDRTILKPAIATIDSKFRDQPLVDAQLRQVLADRYVALTLYAEAAPLQARALEIRTKLLGEDDPLTISSMVSSAYLLSMQGMFPEAEAKFRDALARRIRVLGDDARDTMDSRAWLAEMLAHAGRGKEAEDLLRVVVEWRERRLGERDRATVTSMLVLSLALSLQERLDEARAVITDAFARATAALGPDDRITIECLSSIAVLDQRTGRLLEAEKHFREILAHHRRVYGEDHHYTLIIVGNLGFVLREQGRYAEAHPLIVDSYERRKRTLGEDNPSTLWSLHDLGTSFLDQDRLEEALDCLRRAWEGRRRAYGDANEFANHTLDQYTFVLRSLGREKEAAAVVRGALERIRETGVEKGPVATRARCLLAAALVEADPAEAEALFREVMGEGLKDEGPDSFTVVDATAGLALATALQGDVDGAAKVLREAIESRKASDVKVVVPLANGLLRVADEYKDWRDVGKREALQREAVRIRRAALGGEHPETLDAVSRLGVTLQHQDRQFEAEPLLREAYETRRRVLGPDHRDTLTSLRNMWIVLLDLGRMAEAEPLCREDLERLQNWRGPLDEGRRLALVDVCNAMAQILGMQGRAAEAEPGFRATVARLRKEAGDESPVTVSAIFGLARLLQGLPKLDEAEELTREAVRLAERLPEGPDSLLAHDARMTLGGVLWSRGRFDQSLPLFTAEAERMRAAYGPAHVLTLMTTANVAINYRSTGRLEEAADLFKATFEEARKAGCERDLASYFGSYMDALQAANRRDDMVRELCRATDDARARNPDPGLGRAAATLSYIGPLLDVEAWVEAEAYLRDAIALREAAAPDLWSLFNARALLGETLFRRDRFAEAEPLVVGGYEGTAAREASMPPESRHWLAKGADRILRFYAAWDAAEPGQGHDRALAGWEAKLADRLADPGR